MKPIPPLFAALPRVCVSALLMMLMTLSGGAAASSDASTDALHRAQSVWDVPASISVFDGDDIERRGFDSLIDLSRAAPGFTATDFGPRGPRRNANELFARGLGAGVSAYLGEIPVGFDARLHDLERVEILRGPQGVHYGLGVMAGAVRYLPRKPDPSRRAFEVGGELFDYAHGADVGGDLRLVLNQPLGDVTVRAAMRFHDDPGFIDYDHLLRAPGESFPKNPDHLREIEDANTERADSIRLSALWQINDALRTTLWYDFEEHSVGGFQANHFVATGSGRYENEYRYREHIDRKRETLGVDVDAQLGFARLTSSLGYNETEYVGQRDQTDLLLGFSIPGLLPAPTTSLPDPFTPGDTCEDATPSSFCSFSAFTRDEGDTEAFDWKVQLISNDDYERKWHWLAGFAYRDADSVGRSREFAPGLSAAANADRWDGIDIDMDLEYDSRSRGASKTTEYFGELARDIGDWRFSVGARRMQYDSQSTGATDFPFTQDGAPNPLTTYSARGDADALSLTAVYRPNSNESLYISRVEGAGAGGVNDLPVCTAEQLAEISSGNEVSCVHASQAMYDPDAITNYEIGVRSRSDGGRFAVNAAVFQTEWDDRQIGATSASAQLITVNGGRAQANGIELRLNAHLSDSLRADAFWSHTRARLTDDFPHNSAVDGAKGDRLPDAPRNQSGVLFDYRRALHRQMNLSLLYEYNYTGNIVTTYGGRGGETLPGYAVQNLTAAIDKDDWRLSFYIHNLANKYAVTAVEQSSADIGTSADGFEWRLYNQYILAPRRVGLRFSYRF